ncbi:M23 family metallopeptidase [Halobacillus halophilus]|uniref:M23 family metallopeptidase n=1 Tax=Halobacillus halophilus TaxID=1570 RepID=UPI001CD1DFD7|nr:M23 family metallopeptidase [Halobacillus halophilus]MCA1011800.1 peptidoglycan DD-metalloendopeptidase family protein [Halobacillus halophilus]
MKKDRKAVVTKAAFTGALVLSLTVGTAYAEKNLNTVYQVYVDDEPIGTVENKEDIQSFIEDRVHRAEITYSEEDLNLNEDITFTPEKNLSSESKKAKVLERLGESISVSAESVQVNIDDQTVAHLSADEEIEEVKQRLKEKYVEEETLTQLESQDSKGKPIEMEERASGILSVELSHEIKGESSEVHPSQISSVSQVVREVKKGTVVENSQGGNKPVEGEVSEPLTEVVVQEKDVEEQTIESSRKIVKTNDLLKGETETKQEGSDGRKEIHTLITKKNGSVEARETLKEEVVEEPVEEVILKGTKIIPSRGTGTFAWPAVEGTITSHVGERWGRYHKGIDIAGVDDRTIKAADNGEVVTAEYQSGFGNKVVIDHNNGYETIYAHLDSIDVEVGETVRKGNKLGVMGTTGNSTGIHLHFEIHKDGKLEDPDSFF